MRPLLPPLNYRRVEHRCCMSCREFSWDDMEEAVGHCVRPGGPEGEMAYNKLTDYVCDRWRKKEEP
jgi:hypothetical protein